MSINKIKIFTIVVTFVALALDQITNADISPDKLVGEWHLIAVSKHQQETSVMSCGRMVVSPFDHESVRTRHISKRDGARFEYETLSVIQGSEVIVLVISGAHVISVPHYYSVWSYNRGEDLIWFDNNSTEIHQLYSRYQSASEESKIAFNYYMSKKGFRIQYIRNFDC